MAASEDDDIADLCTFLGAANVELRVKAATIVQGLTGSDDGVSQLVGRADEVILPLLRLLPRTGTEEANLAGTSLVNLCAHERAADVALQHGAVDRALEVLHTGCASSLRRLLLMLVANLTARPEGVEQLLKPGRAGLEGFHLRHLLRLLASDADTNAHAALAIANATAVESGRSLVQMDSPDAITTLALVLPSMAPLPAKEGAALALRNLALETSSRATMLLCTDMIPALLQPLRPPHAAATDALRGACADTIASLAADDCGRQALWAAGAVKLLEQCYEAEPDDGSSVSTALERAALSLVTANPSLDNASDG